MGPNQHNAESSQLLQSQTHIHKERGPNERAAGTTADKSACYILSTSWRSVWLSVGTQVGARSARPPLPSQGICLFVGSSDPLRGFWARECPEGIPPFNGQLQCTNASHASGVRQDRGCFLQHFLQAGLVAQVILLTPPNAPCAGYYY